jgi:PTS system mannose-specific IIB component
MIALVRVDNRLVHGQVLETWVPRLKVKRVVVADDEAAATPLARAAMTLALPADLPASVVPLTEVDFRALAASPEPVLILVREVEGLARAVAGGLDPALAPQLNIGNVHYAPGRRSVTPSVFLSAQELDQLERLVEAGFRVEARAVPTEAGAGTPALRQKYDSAGQRG